MAIKTKSIYEPAEKDDGHRVLVTRFYPRGVKKDRFDEWLRVLSPSRDLLLSYRKGEKDWNEFEAELVSEIRGNPQAMEAARGLHRLAKRGSVTLLCYEKAGEPCHRHTVKRIIDSLK